MRCADFFLLGLLASVAASCDSEMDCSLNGLCTRGVCQCDGPWSGLDCSQLRFKPALISSCGKACAYHAMDKRNTSWGGSVIRGGDGRFYMAAAEMAGGCTLDSWTTNSQVAIAVADRPEGPYAKQQVAVPPWSHNPQMVRATDGTYLIFTLGDGTPSPHGGFKHCGGSARGQDISETSASASSRSGGAEDVPMENKTVGFTIHYSSSPGGPWSVWRTTVPDFRGVDNMDNWNPAPVVMPDGRVRVMAHTDPSPWAGEVILEARHWKGPYTRITDDVQSYCTRCQEDPFMWVDRRGNWHALLHKMFDPSGGSPVPSPGWPGGHIFSKDGLTWSEMRRAYSTNVTLESGEVLVLLRRERPKLILDEQGVPTHLTNGAIMPDGETYTIVQPLDLGLEGSSGTFYA
eukprot:CAMPEP_0204523498 /NCGR_PEP_ID=MMETSP0661-20131031/6869_1 /ASSEMBLY_ACC=CAM_ASM_000606 /TAXON_ID=109239 /ORGANISM="Alexandrium margalefi, Strain AMGDE01CS-322" /LENGTH=402 /DNA_ID=CAMNT_0051529197 /DNA_START=42 /DNA_END=1250 /DNA_ORIENTATION=-